MYCNFLNSLPFFGNCAAAPKVLSLLVTVATMVVTAITAKIICLSSAFALEVGSEIFAFVSKKVNCWLQNAFSVVSRCEHRFAVSTASLGSHCDCFWSPQDLYLFYLHMVDASRCLMWNNWNYDSWIQSKNGFDFGYRWTQYSDSFKRTKLICQNLLSQLLGLNYVINPFDLLYQVWNSQLAFIKELNM